MCDLVEKFLADFQYSSESEFQVSVLMKYDVFLWKKTSADLSLKEDYEEVAGQYHHSFTKDFSKMFDGVKGVQLDSSELLQKTGKLDLQEDVKGLVYLKVEGEQALSQCLQKLKEYFEVLKDIDEAPVKDFEDFVSVEVTKD